jgi:hypothetical protein
MVEPTEDPETEDVNISAGGLVATIVGGLFLLSIGGISIWYVRRRPSHPISSFRMM